MFNLFKTTDKNEEESPQRFFFQTLIYIDPEADPINYNYLNKLLTNEKYSVCHASNDWNKPVIIINLQIVAKNIQLAIQNLLIDSFFHTRPGRSKYILGSINHKKNTITYFEPAKKEYYVFLLEKLTQHTKRILSSFNNTSNNKLIEYRIICIDASSTKPIILKHDKIKKLIQRKYNEYRKAVNQYYQ